MRDDCCTNEGLENEFELDFLIFSSFRRQISFKDKVGGKLIRWGKLSSFMYLFFKIQK